MRKIFSLLAVMLIALVATQAIDAKSTKNFAYDRVVDGVRIVVCENYDPDPNTGFRHFYIGAHNQTSSPQRVKLRVSGSKNGAASALIYNGSFVVAPGKQEIVFETRGQKYTNVVVSTAEVKKP